MSGNAGVSVGGGFHGEDMDSNEDGYDFQEVFEDNVDNLDVDNRGMDGEVCASCRSKTKFHSRRWGRDNPI